MAAQQPPGDSKPSIMDSQQPPEASETNKDFFVIIRKWRHQNRIINSVEKKEKKYTRHPKGFGIITKT